MKDARPVLRGELRQSVDDGDGLGPTAGAAQTIDAGDRECYAYSPRGSWDLAARGPMTTASGLAAEGGPALPAVAHGFRSWRNQSRMELELLAK